MAENWIDTLLSEAEAYGKAKRKERASRQRARAKLKEKPKPEPLPFAQQRWEPVAIVGVFSRRTCRACGTIAFGACQSDNLFIRHQRNHAEAPRGLDKLQHAKCPPEPDVWEARAADVHSPPSVYASLPRETRVMTKVTDVCEDCWASGLPDQPTRALPLHYHDTPALPSPEDIPESHIDLDDLFSTKERGKLL